MTLVILVNQLEAVA